MKFAYTAFSSDGKKQTGTLVAATAVVAGHTLKEQGLTPLELKEEKVHTSTDFFSNLRGVKLADKIVFIQDLSVMLKSGIPISRSLNIIGKQTSNKKFSKIIADITSAVENGKSLNEALAKYPNVFSEIFVSMIKVGEMSGNLDQSLEYLVVQLEREADLRSHVKGAMMYPTVILIAMLALGVVMSIFILPKLTAVFKDFDVELPFMTRVVIAISDFMSQNSIAVIVGIFIFAGLIAWFVRTTVGKRMMFTLSIYAPLINPVVKKINLARFARIFSSLLKSGIPIVEGLKVSGESIPNVLYREVLVQASEDVRVGKVLTDTLAKYDRLFPYITVQMLQVGEETGNLETILEQLAVHYEAEVDLVLKNFSSIIEPILLLVIGGVVGVLAYAMIIPIYNITGNS